MAKYGANLRLNLHFSKSRYINMFTYFHIKVSYTFTVIGIIEECTVKLITAPKVTCLVETSEKKSLLLVLLYFSSISLKLMPKLKKS